MTRLAYMWLVVLMLTGLLYLIYPLTPLMPLLQPLFWFSLFMFVGTVYLAKLQARRYF